MMTYRINIPLSPQEFEALRNVSRLQLRNPRDQARLILRSVLMSEPSAEMNKPAIAESLTTRSNNGSVTVNQ